MFWVPIIGYETEYMINRNGEVLSLPRRGSLTYNIIDQSPAGAGYLKVHLWKNGKQNQRYVHRLLCIQFVPNPDNKPEVNHIDGNITNNSLDNLEWVTSNENRIHSFKYLGRTLGKGETHIGAVYKDWQILAAIFYYSKGYKPTVIDKLLGFKYGYTSKIIYRLKKREV